MEPRPGGPESQGSCARLCPQPQRRDQTEALWAGEAIQVTRDGSPSILKHLSSSLGRGCVGKSWGCGGLD